eukprot:gene23863-10018_t
MSSRSPSTLLVSPKRARNLTIPNPFPAGERLTKI